MVRQNTVESEIQLPVQPEQSFLPRRAQPWETASVALGIPGAMASAALTCAVLMYAPSGDALLAWTLAGLVISAYLTAMTVCWIGVASEHA
jgi:hypothetical protein